MTFQNLDALMHFLEQIAADKMREFETHMLLRDNADLDDNIALVIDGCREYHDEAMVEWRVETRRRLAALPFKPNGYTRTGAADPPPRNWVFIPLRESLRWSGMRCSSPRRSSNSRTRVSPASDVTCEPWNATFSRPLNVN